MLPLFRGEERRSVGLMCEFTTLSALYSANYCTCNLLGRRVTVSNTGSVWSRIVHVTTVRSETFAVFAVLHGIRENLIRPFMFSAMHRSLIKEQRSRSVVRFRILYRSFSRPLCRSSHYSPPSDAPYPTKIWKAAGEDQLQQFALY